MSARLYIDALFEAETIDQAAIMLNGAGEDDDPIVYSGEDHRSAEMAASDAGENLNHGWVSGFVTSKGRFVNRETGYHIAMRTKQIEPEEYADHENEGRPRLARRSPDERKGLESNAFNNSRTDWRA